MKSFKSFAESTWGPHGTPKKVKNQKSLKQMGNDEHMARKGYATHIPHKSDGSTFVITHKANKKPGTDQWHMSTKDKNGKVTKDLGSHSSHSGAKKFGSSRGYVGEAKEAPDHAGAIKRAYYLFNGRDGKNVADIRKILKKEFGHSYTASEVLKMTGNPQAIKFLHKNAR